MAAGHLKARVAAACSDACLVPTESCAALFLSGLWMGGVGACMFAAQVLGAAAAVKMLSGKLQQPQHP